MVDAEYLRTHYGRLNDQELDRLFRGEMVPEARALLEAEMNARGIVPVLQASGDVSKSLGSEHRSTTVDPYAPPGAPVADLGATATIAVSGLIRLFQVMVITSTSIGLLIFALPFLPLPINPDLMALRSQSGADAISFAAGEVIFFLLQPLWILSAVGLYFFKWWGRPAFVAAYLLSVIGRLLGGVSVWLPWELTLVTIATLLDGAVLVLAFLPPLSTYFAHDQA